MFDIYWWDHTTIDFLKAIESAKQQSRTEYVWLLHRGVDYKNFNIRWMPTRHQANFIHAWGSHNNKSCFTTWLIPVNSNWDTTDKVFHENILPFNKSKYYQVCCINTGKDKQHDADFNVRLITTMHETIKNAINKATAEWLWIIADCCEYNNFDFDWLPDTFNQHYIHCWPSGTCKRGDTFLLHVPSHVNKNNYEYHFLNQSIPRKPWTIMQYNIDSIVPTLNHRTNEIYNVFSNQLFVDYNIPDVCLWEKRPVVSLNKSNSISLIPRDCVVEKEIYEYPYILKEHVYEDIQCDVIFISNYESMSYENYQHLKTIYPDAKHSYGVDGRDNAYKAAAKLSDTPFFYAVFAKTRVNEDFKFDFFPDFWQEPKHYIFHSLNPLNGLEYGSMNVNLYNKDLVLQTNTGLDFTLSSKHTVVPLCISTTRFNNEPYITWRSAFREVIKLRQELETHNRVEVAYRYHCWKTIANGVNAEWCLRGANDADKFYDNVKGNPTELQNSFSWDWCNDYFNSIYNNLDFETN
ncbi:hypothetical protein EB001_00730 [bacterium]|nr:hypothetical protein [bacterium]